MTVWSDLSMEVLQVDLLKRQPHLSRAEFQQHWKDVHGPLAVKLMDEVGFFYYEQWHTVGEEGSNEGFAGKMREARGIPPDQEFDGISVTFFDDMEAYEAREESSELMEDDAKFIDFSKSASFRMKAGCESGTLRSIHPQELEGELTSTILTVATMRSPSLSDISREEFQGKWKLDHGAKVGRMCNDDWGGKYLQLHTVEPAGGKWGTEAQDFEGMSVWWTDVNNWNRRQNQAPGKAMLKDEQAFFDLPKCFIQHVSREFSSLEFQQKLDLEEDERQEKAAAAKL